MAWNTFRITVPVWEGGGGGGGGGRLVTSGLPHRAANNAENAETIIQRHFPTTRKSELFVINTGLPRSLYW